MEIVVLLEDVGVGQKVHFGAALFGVAGHFHGGHFNAVHRLGDAVLHKALGKFQLVHFAFAPHRQAQPLAQRIHAAHTHAVQTA
jgi:drug/metabolite transporter superfamily protein YnfA